jgi:putative restriction endonuclease
MIADQFDRPLFKKLASNDTGESPGHQAGILIPKAMESYFPRLKGITTPENPTLDRRIRAELFIGSTFIGIVDTRYQYQTWADKRKVERRITNNLGDFHKKAKGEDIVIFERSLQDPDYFRLTLLQQETKGYAEAAKQAAGRRWGALVSGDPPVTETEVAKAEKEIDQRSQKPFALFQPDALLEETRVKRIARSRAFRTRVTALYSCTCAVCGLSLVDRDGVSEAEAAHIVPRRLMGADDPRNGLSLCRSHHWAFDRGLFGVQQGVVRLGSATLSDSRNGHLEPFKGKTLLQPVNSTFAPASEALDWHFANLVCVSS